MFNSHPYQSLSMMNWNSNFMKSSTPRLTTVIMPACYCILSIGQGMRALTKKISGYLLPNSDMLQNLLWTSTLHTWPSMTLCQVFNSQLLYFWCSSFLGITLFYVQVNLI